jgi:hypothetical protein
MTIKWLLSGGVVHWRSCHSQVSTPYCNAAGPNRPIAAPKCLPHMTWDSGFIRLPSGAPLHLSTNKEVGWKGFQGIEALQFSTLRLQKLPCFHCGTKAPYSVFEHLTAAACWREQTPQVISNVSPVNTGTSSLPVQKQAWDGRVEGRPLFRLL